MVPLLARTNLPFMVFLFALAGCQQNDDTISRNAGTSSLAHQKAGFGAGAPIADASSPPVATASSGFSGGDQHALIQRVRAFLAQPAQDQDMQTALKARASGSPAACPSAAFVPAATNVGASPPPSFDASGAMVSGSVRQRFTMVGCPTPLTLNVFVVAAPGAPIRTISGLSGATAGSPDLQTETLPYAIAAAKPLVPGCPHLTVVDTRLNGADPTANGPASQPWSETWLVAGCGRQVSTELQFMPQPATGHTQVRTDPDSSRLVGSPS